MILLTKTEEILLVQFHEAKGERVGARAGDKLPASAFRKTEDDSKGLEFEGAMDTLVAHNLVKKEGEDYVLTQEGYDYLYTREGGRRLDEG
jgi:hypothetical protein